MTPALVTTGFGVLLALAGVFLLFGLACTLLVAGLWLIACGMFVMPVRGPDQPQPVRRIDGVVAP